MQQALFNPAAMGGPDIFEGLNNAQREAVEALDGPVLVLAGAGTGKTRVLTSRLAHILLTGRATPFEIMAVTFTNKAAREMQERVSKLTGSPTEGWFMGTFHALGARILRKHAERVGLKSNFTILDSDDQQRLVKQILEAENVDTKKTPPRMVLAIIERWKDRGWLPDQVPSADASAQGRFLSFYRTYQDRLRTLNACDFGDLLLYNLHLLQNHPDLLQEYQHRFRYVLVDEYQDTNVAQYLWLRLLMLNSDGTPRNICCVGDEDQSIYGWRGAEIGNILRFERDFPGAKIVRLEENYRSTGHILGAASVLIEQNQDRLGKTLWTTSGQGEPVRVKSVWDGESEARYVGEEIESFQRKGVGLSKIAVLVRAGFQTREFEDRFLSIGLPYKVIGGPRFYERQEIRDALAYLRLIAVPEDDLAFERIINLPRRGVGTAALQTIHLRAKQDGVPLIEAVRRIGSEGGFTPKLRTTLLAFIQTYDRWRQSVGDLPHPELAELVLEESGYTAMWMGEKTPDAAGRLENLKELINAMAEFDNMQSFLEHVSLVMEAHEKKDVEQVSLMTLHAAKGLEFDVVFLPGWEEEIFPSRRTLEENGTKGLEEERRLAYVGITRARKRAFISHAASRLVYGSWTHAIPSRFISELPKEHIVVQAEAGMFSGQRMQVQERGDYRSQHGEFQNFQPRRGIPAPDIGEFHHPRRPPVVLEGRARVVEKREPDRRYRKDERVFHDKFGYGTVKLVEGNKLEVTFDHSGDKKVMAAFIVPADQAEQAAS
jgi:DNA helicase-2/ATP-dependent DNA helicase PcrA